MKKKLSRWALDVWYQDHFIGAWLMPLGFLFADFVKFRKFLFRIGVLKTHKLGVPVIVVGNITVGGTGKTPLVIWLAQLLTEAGFRPGIISRGYGAQEISSPIVVNTASVASEVGDEALLLAKKSACPVAVSPMRADSAKLLIEQFDCNVILSDDGLQHYALHRDIEIAVIDGERRFGNSYCLPAGPLREPIERLQSVDFIIVNGKASEPGEITMQFIGDTAVNLATGERKPLSEFSGIDCHALAGIGNPGRFFAMLAVAGVDCKTHSFPDHYQFQRQDIEFKTGQAVLMTEKDAVKCIDFAGDQHWFVPVTAVPEADFGQRLLNLLREKT
ncbi:MAG: tetraacyldisaccharide 4'-kinase [Methylococcales bacterium]|nr:tetraacyldisaccharide 4'-kinase [Methylococcaceae bacterium]